MSAAVVLPPWAPELPDVLDRLGPAWTRIGHVPFGAAVDIEHVLLSDAGVAVVTTMADDEDLGHAISEARWRARKITALLGRVAWVPATPVLIASGLAQLEIAGDYELLDGVLVVRTVDAPSWIAHLDAMPPVLESACIAGMVDVIVAHTQRTDAIVSTYRTP